MKYLVGLRVSVQVDQVIASGIKVILNNGRRGFIHWRDFGPLWDLKKNSFTKGQILRLVIVAINEKGEILLSLNRVNESTLVDPTNPFNKSDDFAGTLKCLLKEAEDLFNQCN